MTGTQAMTGADAAWFHMDRPTNRMVINAVLTFDEPLDLDRLRALVRDRLVAPFPRFRQLAVESGPLGGLHWEDARHFDLDLHVHRRALTAPGDQRALQDLEADLMATALDPGKPLWDFYLVDGYGAGSALIVRMHHCIADGIALAHVLLTLTDAAPDDREAPVAPLAPAPHHSAIASLTAPLRSAAGLGRDVAGTLVHESVESLLHPAHLLDLGREVRDDASALVDMLVARSDAQTVLKGDHGIAQRVAWTTALSLPDVKDVAHATNTTVNDVLLAGLSGGFARYLAAHGELVDELHAMVPFNIRPPDEPLPAELGNRFGLILLGLPLRESSPRERLQEVHRRMDAIKSSRQPAVSFAVLGAMGRAPAQVEGRLIDFMTAKCTSVVTNVPGPREQVFLAGVRVRDVLVWAPCAGSVGMSVSIFSYSDTITVGFMTHASLVPDPDTLADDLVAELGTLRESVQASST